VAVSDDNGWLILARDDHNAAAATVSFGQASNVTGNVTHFIAFHCIVTRWRRKLTILIVKMSYVQFY